MEEKNKQEPQLEIMRTMMALVFSLLFIITSCNYEGGNCDDKLFYRSQDVDIKEILTQKDSSSIYLVYSTLAETMYYSSGISVVGVKNGFPSEIIVHRIGIDKKKQQSYEYQSYVGREFKKSNPDISNSNISDYDYVVHIPMNKINVKKGSSIDCAETVKLN